MKPQQVSCAEARKIDMIDYLAILGHFPTKTNNEDYWYLSPLRIENNASFKVNRKLNKWYDHGTGKGGNLIDFGVLYHQCSVQAFLWTLAGGSGMGIFHWSCPRGNIKPVNEMSKIQIREIGEIKNFQLLSYLNTRKIPLVVAKEFCVEVKFKLYGKENTAIGFKNDLGGYELRNKFFKGSSAPKNITSLVNGAQHLFVFEGFFDFLSFQAMRPYLECGLSDLRQEILGDYLILNSLAFFEKNRPLMDTYRLIHLYLDRDNSGLRCSEKAVSWSAKYLDESKYFAQFKDINELLVARSSAGQSVD